VENESVCAAKSYSKAKMYPELESASVAKTYPSKEVSPNAPSIFEEEKKIHRKL
jgi:hypothetical protein